MDFSKYVDLLTTNELHFTRADKLEDPYDCSRMQFFGEAQKQLSLEYPQIKEGTHQHNTFNRLFVYLNCWHMNDVESAALWRLYSENKYETIAIQTTFGQLNSEIKLKWPRVGIFISKVKYDPENAGESLDEMPGGKLFTALGWENIIYKRPSFEHEEELRAFIYQRVDKLKEVQLRNKAHLEKLKKERTEYIRIKINPSCLIEKVYVSPLAKDLFVELVKKVSGDLNDRVLKSPLYELY
jgi:predicted DNA binding CopG/RHH family protein